jgi:two-component system response regulator
MDKDIKPIIILMAEDDPDDRYLTKEALSESRIANELYFVEDGEELMKFLKRIGKYQNPADSPRPGIILLDLNMPKKDGREALKEIKSDDNLKQIPVIILTTSDAEEDVLKTYNLGANSFITKPVTFSGLLSVIKALENYWFEIVRLPNNN